MRSWNTISARPCQPPYTLVNPQSIPPLLRHPGLLGLLCHSPHGLGELWRCPSSMTMTQAAARLSGTLGARRWGM